MSVRAHCDCGNYHFESCVCCRRVFFAWPLCPSLFVFWICHLEADARVWRVCEKWVWFHILLATRGLSVGLAVHREPWWYVLCEPWPRSIVFVWLPHIWSHRWVRCRNLLMCASSGGRGRDYWNWWQRAVRSRVNMEWRVAHMSLPWRVLQCLFSEDTNCTSATMQLGVSGLETEQ